MLRSHVDLAGAVWVVPKSKNNTELRIPLSDAAIALLEAVKAQNLDPDLVFPEAPGKPLHHSAMIGVLAGMPDFGKLTVHGLRATFKTWASEQTNFQNEVIEAALGHKIRTGSSAPTAAVTCSKATPPDGCLGRLSR